MASPPPARTPRVIPFVGYDPNDQLTLTWVGWLYLATGCAALFGLVIGFVVGYLVG